MKYLLLLLALTSSFANAQLVSTQTTQHKPAGDTDSLIA